MKTSIYNIFEKYKLSPKSHINESGELVLLESESDKIINKLCSLKSIRAISYLYVWSIILYPCCKILFTYSIFISASMPLKVVIYLVILFKVHQFSLFVHDYINSRKVENAS